VSARRLFAACLLAWLPWASAGAGKPIFRMQPEEVHALLGALHESEPDLRKRIATLARRNIGQPYEGFLLGEFPYELTDRQPLFDLAKSDCLVFAEHTYAMALAKSWEEFFWMLQRLRYKDGVIGVTTRNHFQEADWNAHNAWLLRDVTHELGGDAVVPYSMLVDRAAFFRKAFKIERAAPVQLVQDLYIPKDRIGPALRALDNGDFVNVVSDRGGETLVTHVGLIVVGDGGERRLVHSAEPAVREESFAEFIRRAEARSARGAGGRVPTKLLGFKFLRLNPRPDPPPMLPQPRPR
jgi:hypothetical protein